MSMTATQIARRDHRLWMIAQSAAAEAMADVRELSPDRALADMHDIAVKAAMLAIVHIVTEDAELNAARIERDHYKQIALDGLLLNRMSLTPPVEQFNETAVEQIPDGSGK